MSGNLSMNPYLFAGLPDYVQNKVMAKDYNDGSESLIAVARIVSDITNVSVKELRSPKRTGRIRDARHLYMYFAYHVCQDVVKVAGFVNRDHSTCSHSMKTVISRRNGFGESKFKETFDSIDSKINIKTIKDKVGRQYRDTPYIVYPDGRVVNGRLGNDIKPFKHKSGQMWVSLFIDRKNGNGRGVKKLVKSMVAECYLDNPFGRKIIVHKDGNSENNNVENLFWGDRKEQQRHIMKYQLRETKFNAEQILNIREMHDKGKSQKNIAEIMNTSKSMISLIINKKIYDFVK